MTGGRRRTGVARAGAEAAGGAAGGGGAAAEQHQAGLHARRRGPADRVLAAPAAVRPPHSATVEPSMPALCISDASRLESTHRQEEAAPSGFRTQICLHCCRKPRGPCLAPPRRIAFTCATGRPTSWWKSSCCLPTSAWRKRSPPRSRTVRCCAATRRPTPASWRPPPPPQRTRYVFLGGDPFHHFHRIIAYGTSALTVHRIFCRLAAVLYCVHSYDSPSGVL